MIDETEIIEIRILQLLESEARWWTIEEIASLLGLSKATIQKYLNNLKGRTENYPKEDIFLETSTSKGITLHRSLSFNVQFLYTQILKELLIFSIFSNFLYSEHVSIVKLSTEHFISVASVRRKYRSYNIYFKNLNLSIKKDIFSGDERQIRWFFSEFYWQIFRGTEWPFRLIPQEFANSVLRKIQVFFNITLIPEVKEEMLYWMTINGIRHVKGYRVPEDNEIQKYALNNPLFFSFAEIMKDIFPNETKNNDPSAPGEMQYLFLLISALPVLEKNEEYSHLIYQAHKKGQTLMHSMSLDWLELYEDIFGAIDSESIRYEVENKLLRIHSFSYLYHMGEDLFLKKNYVNEIINFHPQFFEKLEYIHEVLDKKYSKITINKTYLFENYALLAMEHLAINQFEKTVRLSLSFSKGILYESIVRKKILTYFSSKYKLDFVNIFEPKEILITDLPYVIEEETGTLVSVQTMLTDRDYKNIEDAILNYI